MNDSKVTLIGLVFFLICAGLVGGVHFTYSKLNELKDEYVRLENQRATLSQDTMELREQINTFNNAFKVLEAYNVRATSSDINFKAEVQEKIDEYIEAITTAKSTQGATRDGRSSISYSIRGDYYSFLKILAGWRNLQTTVRVSALSMTASKTPQTSGEILADVTVEAIVSAK